MPRSIISFSNVGGMDNSREMLQTATAGRESVCPHPEAYGDLRTMHGLLSDYCLSESCTTAPHILLSSA